jgi:hypothetical protein
MRFEGRTIPCISSLHDSRCMRRLSSSRYKDWVMMISCIHAVIEYEALNPYIGVAISISIRSSLDFPALQSEVHLVAKLEATVRRDNAAGRPSTIRRAKHSNSASDLRLVRL